MDLSMNEKEYKDVVKEIKKAANNSKDNNKHFDISFGKCTGATITSYQNAINALKTQLAAYCDCILSDVEKLNTIRTNYQNLDKNNTITPCPTPAPSAISTPYPTTSPYTSMPPYSSPNQTTAPYAPTAPYATMPPYSSPNQTAAPYAPTAPYATMPPYSSPNQPAAPYATSAPTTTPTPTPAPTPAPTEH